MIKTDKYLKETIQEILEKVKNNYINKVINCDIGYLNSLMDSLEIKCYEGRNLSKKIAIDNLEKIHSFLLNVNVCAKINDLDYLIDEKGECFSIKSFKTLKKRVKGKVRKYNSFTLYDIDNKGKNYATHRLVATYFVKNTDPDKNIIVNHIDNNSLNNHYSNLEWCTYSHNTQHSYDYTDRKSINKIIYLTNIKTSELFIFKSIYEVAKFLNIDRSSISHYISKRTNKEYLIEHYSNIEDISRINEKYKRLLKEVINKGFSYEDPNRIGVNRLQIPTYTFSHYFKSEGFPILTLKKSFVESAFKEMKMFMSGESDLKVLKKEGINFWDKDGYTFAKRQGYKETFEEFIDFVKNKGFDLGSIYPHHMRNFNNTTDQIKNLIDNLKTNPFATKKTVTMWNPSDTNYCLSPCHWAFEAIVTPPVSVGRKNRLTIKWHQHSTDVFLGLPMNIMYYSFVCLFLAKCCNMEAFGIIGDLSNVHLYENSVIAAKKVINTDNTFPKVKVITSLELSDDIDKMLNTFSYSIDDTNHGGVLNVEMLPYSF